MIISSSAIVWEDKSPFTGDPIVGIVTGLDGSSNNPKTGKMAQLWILRSDMHPSEALESGGDQAICGDCPLRPQDGKRVCYVNPMGPAAVYRSFRDGRYDHIDPWIINTRLQESNIPIRLGAYGEPVALPKGVLTTLTKDLTWTGYTHQWRTKRAQPYKDLLMASVDSPVEYDLAHDMGWRTFRVRGSDQPKLPLEVICPASEEAGYRTTCSQCHLCQGTSFKARSVVIQVHGPGQIHFDA